MNVLQKRFAIAEACLIGLISALAAVLLKHSIGWLGALRIQASLWLPAEIVLPIIGLVLGFVCGWLLEKFSLESTGSGIPQVKAVLGHFPLALNLRVGLIKLITTILALASGLTMGRQGPTVHIGAAVAAQLSNWFPTSPEHRRQMIAAGAGAGLAAGFNTPIAGVLFVLEELLQDFSGLTLGTAILASFIGAVVSRLLGGGSLDLNLEFTTLSNTFFAPEIPFYLFLGVLCGALGGLFTKGILGSLKLYKSIQLSLPMRIALAGFVSGCVVALLPTEFRNNSGLRELLLSNQTSWKFALMAFLAHFVLTLVAYGSGAPGGLFNPALILGSALGYVVGLVESQVLGVSAPTTYTLAGMGAFFSAVTKGPITAIVIVFEMTADFNVVLPLMIACAVSYFVSEQVVKGSLYQHLLEWNGYVVPDTADGGIFAGLKAEDIMQRRVETLSSKMPFDEVVQAFSRSHHRGFPVVDGARLVGIITQTDLAKATQHQLPGDILLEQIMTHKPVTIESKASLTDALYLLNRYQLSRLPVTEGRKLVGIITRSDLIRAEVDRISGNSPEMGPRPESSYVVYQTKSPAVGGGRLLVPLANPRTAESLLELAAAIARDRNYELECLQVILVPRHQSPAETAVTTTKSRRLLRHAETLGRKWNISIHTQIRVAHDVAQAVLETINERHIDLIVMGWNGSTSTPGRIFGNVVDTIIRQAACEVVLVKLSHKTRQNVRDLGLYDTTEDSQAKIQNSNWNQWLVPMGGGPNAWEAIQLLPALMSLAESPKVRLCQVFEPSKIVPETPLLDDAVRDLKRLLHRPHHGRSKIPVIATPVRGHSVPDAIVRLADADQCDVVILGASREGLLQQAIHGNIPEAIARGCKSTVILVRRDLAAEPLNGKISPPKQEG